MLTKEKKGKTMATNNEKLDIRTHNSIAEGTNITGDVKTNGNIRFDGKLKGNIFTDKKIVVGPSGAIVGEIHCNNADIEGHVEGKITVNELLSLKATADIKGDIKTKKLAIEPGANFSGTCNMNTDKAKPQETGPQKYEKKGGKQP
jgi:cytoskeletal protein CcmA (bactofilin family)